MSMDATRVPLNSSRPPTDIGYAAERMSFGQKVYIPFHPNIYGRYGMPWSAVETLNAVEWNVPWPAVDVRRTGFFFTNGSPPRRVMHDGAARTLQ
eukprot:gene7246-biopygen4540